MTALPDPYVPARHFPARGRLTRGQRRALEELWSSYGVDSGAQTLSWDALFGRRAPVCLEIGFGMGDALAEMAGARPDRDYLGVDVYLPGIGSALKKVHAGGLTNVRLIYGDAAAVLSTAVPPASLREICVFFPDPWPKKRHHKRRLVQPPFIGLAVERLVPGGRLLLATDWEDYAGHMLEVLTATPGLRNTAPAGGFAERPATRPVTKFERRGRGLGHGVWDLVFERC